MSTDAVSALDRSRSGVAGGRARTLMSSAWAATRHFRPVLLLVVVLFVVFAVTQDTFLDRRNLQNMLTAVSVIWVIAMGMTFVTIVGGFDLSAGALASLTGIFVSKCLNGGLPGGLVIALAIVFGAVVGGLVNGTLIGRLNLSFFVVTLASMTAFTGVVNLWSGTISAPMTNEVVNNVGIGTLWSIPVPIWIMVGLLLLCLVVQQRTTFGRDVYAVGGSLPAARLSGIRVPRTIICVYAIVGAASALAGIIASARIGAASPQVNGNLPLQAAAAVLLGGTSLTGGAGGVGGTALGVLFIGILQNGLSLSGVDSYWQQVVTGLILVVAVLGDRLTVSSGLARFVPSRRPKVMPNDTA